MSKLFDSIDVSQDIQQEIDLSFAIADQIHAILIKQGKTQRDLAKMMGKKESEISKWMTGRHNFTSRSLAKISAALGEPIVMTVQQAEEKYADDVIVPVEVSSNINRPTMKAKPNVGSPRWIKMNKSSNNELIAS